MGQVTITQRRFDAPTLAGSPDGGALEGGGYAYDDETVLALNVALRSGRPLLVSGPPGSGKSSLGLDVAYRLRWRYYQELLTRQSRRRDLFYSVVDPSGRMIAPSVAGSPSSVVVPGVLWWAFDPEGAAKQLEVSMSAGDHGQRPGVYPHGAADGAAVVLLDEIDAAPADVALGLAAALDASSFAVPELKHYVRARVVPLLIVATNEMHALPETLTDLCVILRLQPPSEDKLVRVGAAHFPDAPPALLHRAAGALLAVAREHDTLVDTRDYVSLVASGVQLGVEPEDSPAWEPIVRSIGERENDPARRPHASWTGEDAEAVGVRVFISYAREDAPVARRLFEDLSAHGHAPWLDQEALLPGQNWRYVIERAIRESALFLALLSTRSVSKTGYVQKEMREAIRILEEMPPDTVYVVPVRVEECEPPHDALHDLHWVDLFPSYELGLERILQVIQLVPKQMKVR